MISNSLISRMKQARCIAVLTGSGISAESGIPTFRGKQGLWKQYRPQELASNAGFINDPELVWEWYAMRREIIGSVSCNTGHKALARMEDFVPEFWLITQNVDGLHQQAGSKNVLELHGNIMRNRCTVCGAVSPDTSSGSSKGLPTCPCGGLLRPDVVWFGESLPADSLHLAFKASKKCDVFLCIGTSAEVQPAASLPIIAKESGAWVVEINTETTAVTSHVDESFNKPAGQMLPGLVKAVWGS